MNNRLTELRNEKGLSQEEFGKIFKAAQNTVSQWERGTRSPAIEIIIQLADFYKVSIDYLLGRSENRATSRTNKLADIDDEEVQLIKKYRSLDENGKRRVLRFIEGEYEDAQGKSDGLSRKTTA